MLAIFNSIAVARVRQLVNAVRATIAPYEYVQTCVERGFERFIHRAQEDVRLIAIVGGFRGDEIVILAKRFAGASFHVFEPVPATAELLRRRFRNNKRVSVVEAAVSDTNGEAEFQDTNLPGAGSLLQVSAAGCADYGLIVTRAFRVSTVTLDTYAVEQRIEHFDLMWVDVQGAEALVLAGATNSLNRTSAVMLEVSSYSLMYEGAPLLPQLDATLRRKGFSMVLLGCDPDNGTGNALWVRV